MSKIPKEDRPKIEKRILNGESYSEIAREYGVRPSTVGFLGRSMGIMRLPHRPKKWNALEIDQFLIENNSTIQRISPDAAHVKIKMKWKCTLCGHTWDRTFDDLRKESRLIGCPDCKYDEYTVNHWFLDEMNPSVAYFLGAFAARGYLNKASSSNLILFTGEEDKLERVRDLISSTKPIREGHLSFSSRRMSDKLFKYNMEDKGIPKEIPSDLIPAFILGYFTFQGYVEYGINADTGVRVNITGPVKLISDIAKKVKDEFDIGWLQQRKNKLNRAELHILGVEAPYEFLKWISSNKWNVGNLTLDGDKGYCFKFIQGIVQQKEQRRNEIVLAAKQYSDLSLKISKFRRGRLAEKYGVSRGTVKKIEEGRTPPSKVDASTELNIKQDLETLKNLIAEAKKQVKSCSAVFGIKESSIYGIFRREIRLSEMEKKRASWKRK
jgi:transcriptional regulator with XRE-family HTH domain/DNA-directed RNA polymerase subunit RPC12/RpoP